MATRTIRVGSVPFSDGGGDGIGFWNLKDGDTKDLTILADLDEIVSVDQFSIWDFNPAAIWVSIGAEDPGYELGFKPGYKAFIPVAFNGDDGVEVKLWSVGIQIHRSLAEIADLVGGLKGATVRAKRTGSGMSTRYSVLPAPKAKPIKDVEAPPVEKIIDMLGPDTREGVLELIVNRAGMSWERLKEKFSKESGGSDGDVEVEEVDF